MTDRDNGQTPETDYPLFQNKEIINPAIMARRLGIPLTRIDDPEVMQFIALTLAAENLQKGLAIAAARSPLISDSLGEARDLFSAPNMRITIPERYSITELIMRGVVHTLAQDLGSSITQSDSRSYLKGKFSAGLARLGLEVTETRRPK